MKTKINYSILKYIHSRVSNEILNVGVLVEKVDSREFELFIPSDLSRLSILYSDFRPGFLKTYLTSLKQKTDELNAQKFQLIIEDQVDPRSFILRPDDTSLEFGEFKPALVSDSIQRFITGFVPNLFSETSREERHDEVYLKSRLFRSLSQWRGIENKIKKDQEIEFNHLSFKIDFEWQNGTTNLVKAISFDYKDSGQINNKIAQSVGYLNHFREFAEQRNSRFDLLLARPTEKSTFKDYDRALDILSDLKVNKEIIEENRIEQYADRTIAYLRDSDF
ncbi:DUF3037 domain-containing protein [Marinoscillum pacificum]|uniref:DUF3037 domain-containing protein n=1 Tax=Marinoscillum pacificum TaxID=392723 RepID=UPI0021588CE0|nr:DUF3037 domain-containing protein [Marinoscillum pacificum]